MEEETMGVNVTRQYVSTTQSKVRRAAPGESVIHRLRTRVERMGSMKAFIQAGFRRVLSGSFRIWELFGIHITPNYFESPIPDSHSLRDELWSRRSNMVGIDLRETQQLDLLETFVKRYKTEYERFPRSKPRCLYQYYVDNKFFEAVDGEMLYCIIRHFKPHRIYEVGSGNSTLLAAEALLENHRNGRPLAQLVAFDPYPKLSLRTGFPGLGKLRVSKIEDIPSTVFHELEENDILFLDSSHVVRIGGDVQHEFLEILPSLRPGVIVHVHDIFLPAEYPRKMILERRRFFSEQYLLQAFLAFNSNFKVLWASSFMHLNHPDLLERAFDAYARESRWPVSFWIQRVS